jgi:hypothetical protein
MAKAKAIFHRRGEASHPAVPVGFGVGSMMDDANAADIKEPSGTSSSRSEC